MNYLNEFDRIMDLHKEIALATSIANLPNVRIVNFYSDKNRKGVIYFTSFNENDKVKEFKKNSKVAFTTVPSGNSEHVRSVSADVIKSDLTIFDLKDEFIKKIPDYEMAIEMGGSDLILFEIHFSEAVVTLDFDKVGKVNL